MSVSDFVLEVCNLEKTYVKNGTGIFARKNTLKALDDISFNIKKNEIFGLVGESGCGKSTLGRSIVGLTSNIKGEILFNGDNISKVKNISSKIQIVFQDPLSSLNPKKRIGWILEEPLRVHKRGGKEERISRVNKILELIGLDSSYRDRYPGELSGGQRQRISIGCALMLEPELIIADEPVSALDVSVQSQILNLLKDLHEKLNLSYLFISHNLNVVYYMCDRVAVLYLGRIVELAAVDELYDHPAHPYTRALLDAIPEMDSGVKAKAALPGGDLNETTDIGKGCGFYSRCPEATQICRELAPDIHKIDCGANEEHIVYCHHFKSY